MGKFGLNIFEYIGYCNNILARNKQTFATMKKLKMKKNQKCVFVTGGTGFIGTHLVEDLLDQGEFVVVVDLGQESWQKQNRKRLENNPNVKFYTLDIRDRQSLLEKLFQSKPHRIFHLAAESHVDKSITDPALFFESNVRGTVALLEAVTNYWHTTRPKSFRFHYCSTDEVYGSIEKGSFRETFPIHPNNPYSASKAAGEHFVTAWANTHKLPVIITRSSNNYGTHQGPDKFIPLTIGRCLRREPVLLHGNGQNVRDWIHVRDHCQAILHAVNHGRLGEVYNIGGGLSSEKSNLQIVEFLCDCVDELRDDPIMTSRKLIQFVEDRPGNDFRYSMDALKLQQETRWQTTIPFEVGLMETVKWYLDNNDYCTRNTR